MSQLSDIVTAATNALNTQGITVYTDLIPDQVQLPYAVINVTSASPTYTVSDPYIQEVNFRISIWANTLVQAEQYAQVADFAFNRKDFAPTVFGCNRTNYIIPPVTIANQMIIYGAILEYDGWWERSIANG